MISLNTEFNEKRIINRINTLLAFYILFDMLSGFFVIYFSKDLKISLMYKLTLIVLMLFVISIKHRQTLGLILITILTFSLGPLLHFLDFGLVSYFIFDLGVVVKTLLPIITLAYIVISNDFNKIDIYKVIDRILLISFYLVIANLTLGFIGIGKSTYTNGAGTTGLIYAGNELSATFLILTGYFLTKRWLINKKSYVVYSVFCVFYAVIIATKTSLLATIIIAITIPMIVDNSNKKVIYGMFSTAIAISVFVVFNIKPILSSIGIYDRMMWAYQQSGILGLLLSGRQEMVVDRLYYYFVNGSTLEHFFGYGKAYQLFHPTNELVAEIDVVDILIQIGIVPLFTIVFFHILFFAYSLIQAFYTSNKMAPANCLIIFLLLCLSQISGHIWTSGTIGITLGAFYALVANIKIKDECNAIVLS